MSYELPEGKNMWIRSFYGFGPEEDGYVGWSQDVGRDHILKFIQDGDLIMIYGAGSAETEKSLRSYILGFVQVDAAAIRDADKASPEAMVAKAKRGWAEKWTYGIPVRRAWRATEKLLIRQIATKTYRPEAGQAIGVWGAELEAEEIAQALKIKVTEVNVFGEPPINAEGITNEPFAHVFKPSRGFRTPRFLRHQSWHHQFDQSQESWFAPPATNDTCETSAGPAAEVFAFAPAFHRDRLLCVPATKITKQHQSLTSHPRVAGCVCISPLQALWKQQEQTQRCGIDAMHATDWHPQQQHAT